MQLLANENFPLKSVLMLRNAGHDIVSITEDSPGIKDSQVLKRAVLEKRIILTFDRDYGELIYKKRLPIPAGVIYFRFDPVTPEETAEYLLDLFRIEGLHWKGEFTTVERGRIRQRPLPS
jgi:predicted nuclease of predicted toxin-antitoxin system